ncbi:MAG: hypothetical protein ACPGJV_14645, partial [Bacteriovoracaceae bacterium]
MTYWSLIVLAAATFTSVSISALSHILIVPPGVYFFIKWIKERDFKLDFNFLSLFLLLIICILSVVLNWSEIDSPMKNIVKTKYFLIALLSVFAIKNTQKNFFGDKHYSI